MKKDKFKNVSWEKRHDFLYLKNNINPKLCTRFPVLGNYDACNHEHKIYIFTVIAPETEMGITPWNTALNVGTVCAWHFVILNLLAPELFFKF